MRNWTGIEIKEEQDRLEREAASILGFMLFEYSRLDMELGWYLSWSDDAKSLKKMAKKMAAINFSQRLDHSHKRVSEKYCDSPDIIDSHASWISDAHAIRELRNQHFHGRWGVEPVQQRVANVVGLPNSSGQKSTPCSLAELGSALENVRVLRLRLGKLGSACPV